MILYSALPDNLPLAEVREHGWTDLRTKQIFRRAPKARTDDMKAMLERMEANNELR